MANGTRSMAIRSTLYVPIVDATYEMSNCLLSVNVTRGVYANPECVTVVDGRPGGYTALGYADGIGRTAEAKKDDNVTRHIT